MSRHVSIAFLRAPRLREHRSRADRPRRLFAMFLLGLAAGCILGAWL